MHWSVSRFLLFGLMLFGAWNPAYGDSRDVYGPKPLLKKSAGSGAPKIVFDKESYDWGTVLQGDEIEHTFEFTNEGNATLKILDVKPG